MQRKQFINKASTMHKYYTDPIQLLLNSTRKKTHYVMLMHPNCPTGQARSTHVRAVIEKGSDKPTNLLLYHHPRKYEFLQKRNQMHSINKKCITYLNLEATISVNFSAKTTVGCLLEHIDTTYYTQYYPTRFLYIKYIMAVTIFLLI